MTSLLSSGEKEREKEGTHFAFSHAQKVGEEDKRIDSYLVVFSHNPVEGCNGNPSLFLSWSSKWLLLLLLFLLLLLLLRGDEVGNQSHRCSSAVP